MNPDTRKALEESIKHWEDVVRIGPDALIGSLECALCQRFNSLDEDCRLGDELCPVVVRTEKLNCYNSPYVRVAATKRDWNMHDHLMITRDEAWQEERTLLFNEFVERAKCELEFLRSLLPKEP